MNFVCKVAAKLSEDMMWNEVFLEKQLLKFRKKLWAFCSKENNILSSYRLLRNMEINFTFGIESLNEKK